MPYKDRNKQREFQKNWIKARRVAWLIANGPCRSCGSPKNLQVDHIDRRFKVEHRIWSLSAERREAELAKCQVLCSKCHRRKTRKQLSAIAKFQQTWRKLRDGINASTQFGSLA